jgi:hypothetical protein
MSDPPTLGPIEYQAVIIDGHFAGWRVPDHERARWDAGPVRPPALPVDTETLSFGALTDLLEPFSPGLPLRARLAVAYDRDPVQTSRLTHRTLGEADARDPCGLLWYRLGLLSNGDT